MAKEIQLVLVIIETDSQEVADFVNNKKGSKLEIFWVITAIKAVS